MAKLDGMDLELLRHVTFRFSLGCYFISLRNHMFVGVFQWPVYAYTVADKSGELSGFIPNNSISLLPS